MKSLLPALLLLNLLPALPGQNAPLDPSGAVVPDVRLSREQLKELTGPIALYPDPLVAMILPASTFPGDVVLAARFLQSKEDPALADEKPWDESIRGLTRYPDVLTWMDANLEWTSQLGYAYLAQPDEVMDAIQELRAQAQTVGNLVDTPQQRVVREETFIRIVPAEPEYIYVPYYEPEIVYYERPIAEPYLTFSAPWLVGSWLTFDFDWHRHRLYCGDWHGDWDYRYRRDRHDHRGESIFINNSFTNYEVWRGDSRRRLGSARIFAQNRDLLLQRSLATPSYFQERFDLSERERRAVAVSADVRQRDRRNAVGEVTQVAPDRSRFGSDGRIRTQAGERATLTKIADREKERVAVEAKKREDVRARLTAEGKISARDRDGKRIGDGKTREGERTPTPGSVADRERERIGADGKMSERDRERIGADSKKGDRGKVGPDGRMTERTLPGEVPKPGEAPQIGERGKGKASKEGERGKDGVTPLPPAPPAITGEVRSDKRGPDDQGKGKGKGKDASRIPSTQSEIPKADLPKERPEVKDIPKSELPTPKGRPEVKEIPKVAPTPVNPNDTGKRGKADGVGSRSDDKGKGKGKASQPGPRTEAPRIEPSITPKNDPTPRIAPQPKQEVPKVRPQPPVNVEPPKPKVQTPTTVPDRSAPPEKKKKDEPTARRSAPNAPNVVRQAPAPGPSAPKPQVSAVQRPQPQKQAATAPRAQPQKPAAVQPPPAVKPQPQVVTAPNPQQNAVGKKSQEEEDKKKKK